MTVAGAQERALAAAFALRLEELRVRKGLTQERLAFTAGLSNSWLSKIANSQRSITLGTIQRLCDALDVSADELIGGLPKLTARHTKRNRRRYASEPPEGAPPTEDAERSAVGQTSTYRL